MKKLLFIFVLLVHTSQLQAQQGYSSASYGMGKQRSDGLIIPKPSEIVIEEYFNYHTHNLPLPTKEHTVEMDMRWGNPSISRAIPEAILQVGFTTVRGLESIDDTPLHISIVIDHSGSMQGDRIEHARQSAKTLVDKLRPQDFISLVIFDSMITTLLENESAQNKQKIKQAINSIQARGSTDLNGGLIRGYELASKYYIENGNNKVLLLTDVLTNTGEVDVEAIVKNAKNYSQNHLIGITLVAIGVQVNDDLARQITSSGKHSFHYVNDADDIKKIFVDEVEAIFSTAAKEVKLTITLDDNLSIEDVYGYNPQINDNTISLDLNNMNAGLTQVILVKVKAKNPIKMGKATAKLVYYDVRKKKYITEQKDVKLKLNSNTVDILADSEVRKCISIAEMANALKSMAQLLNKSQPTKAEYQKAQDILQTQITEIKNRYTSKMDTDVERVLKMLNNYVVALSGIASR